MREWLTWAVLTEHVHKAIKDAYKSDNSFQLIGDMVGGMFRYFCDSGKGKNLMQYLAI